MKHTKSMVYTPSVEARELFLYATNTGDLYRQRITPAITSLRRKAIKGTYDREKAADLFFYIATAASNMYYRDFSYRFDVTARWTAAVDMAEYYEGEIFYELNA